MLSAYCLTAALLTADVRLHEPFHAVGWLWAFLVRIAAVRLTVRFHRLKIAG